MEEIKDKIEEVFKRISSDKNFADEFKSNPVKAVEDVLGVDLPDDAINKIIDGIKAKLTADSAKSLFDKAKDLFNK